MLKHVLLAFLLLTLPLTAHAQSQGKTWCDNGTGYGCVPPGLASNNTFTGTNTFNNTVTLPASQAVNGVTLSTSAGSTTFLNGAGAYTTPSGGGGTTFLNVVSTAATTRTSSVTLTAITGLSATLVAGTTYIIDVFIPYTAGASGGAKVDLAGGTFTLTSSGTMQIVPILNNTAFASGTGTKLTAVANVADFGASSFPSDGYIELKGTIKVGSTGGGTIIPRIAQSASNGTSTVALAGAFMNIQTAP